MTREQAIDAIASALYGRKQAGIARALTVDDKALRTRTRAGAWKDAEGNKLPPVHVGTEGDAALTEAHVRAIVAHYAPKDDAAVVALAAQLTA